MNMLLALLVLAITTALVILPAAFFLLRWTYRSAKKRNTSNKTTVGIFHPYCNAGGGGEKVVWVAIEAMQEKYPNCDIYIYTGDIEATPTEILEKVQKNLNVKVDKNKIKFVYLTRRKWLEAHMYPYFTLLGQSVGSVYLGFEALNQLNPDIFLDTTGCAFTLPLFKFLGGCSTGCYVHYPTITTEMLKRVSNRSTMYNNRSLIARSPFLTAGKLLYYRVFAWVRLTLSSPYLYASLRFSGDARIGCWNKAIGTFTYRANINDSS